MGTCDSFNGDWGLGIGDWAQSPIPKSPIPNPLINKLIVVTSC